MEVSSLTAGFYAEVDLLCIILLLQLIGKTRGSSFINAHKHYFEAVLLSHIVFSASDLIWIFNNGFLSLPEVFPRCGIALSYLLNSINVLFSGITGFAWLSFSEAMQGNYLVRNRKRFACSLLPILFLLALVLTTRRTHFLFYISEQGEYFRCSGYVIQLVISMGYMAVATALSARRTTRAHTMQEQNRSRAITGFILPPLCSALLQILVPRMQVLFLGTVVALISVYISLQQTQILTDPLTGLNNRTLLDQKITNALGLLESGYDVYLMLIDADHFKSINDHYGHTVGDQVLKMIADAIRRSCNAMDFVCRFGGDEFVVIHYVPRSEGYAEFVRRVDGQLAACSAPCEVSVSIGACRLTPERQDMKELLDCADQDMYRTKSGKKADRNDGK